VAAFPARSSRSGKPMTDTGFMIRVGVVFALFALGVALLVVATRTSSDADPVIPNDIEQVFPAPNAIADPQTQIGADLNDTFIGVLVFDGQEIPEDQLTRVLELGAVSFEPADERDFTKFDAGQHTVTVVYWHQTETRETDSRSFSWHFRVAA
jgi:hypothetical protein